MMPAFLAALRFLTWMPIAGSAQVDGRVLARSSLFYPLVGFLLGLCLWSVFLALGDTPSTVVAAILLLFWTWVTGGLHLDGLADSADAWVGGVGSRERTLDIMKDPATGPIGAVALALLLICKWSALPSLLDGNAALLIWLPALARTQLLLIFLTTPYAGRGGVAGLLAADLPRAPAWIVLVLVWGGCLLLLGGGWVLALSAGLVFALWRRAMMRRLGGFTGDTAGALLELTEVVGMLAFAVFRHPSADAGFGFK
jgi:adenosylcobinamide-GDP ribazoletransferase